MQASPPIQRRVASIAARRMSSFSPDTLHRILRALLEGTGFRVEQVEDGLIQASCR
jgi:hypothetical protein